MFVTPAVVVGMGLAFYRGREPIWRPRQSMTEDEQRFLSAVHAELRAGASLRWALADAATGHDGQILRASRRLALAGAPYAQIARSLRRLPGNGRGVAAAVEVSAVSGGKAADVFLSLANRAAAQADLERQRQVLTAQARFSALVVGGLPVLWLAFGGLGRLRSLIDRGAGAVALVGLTMELVGGLLVWRLAAR